MSWQFESHAKAKAAAIEYSRTNPGKWYVNWIEDNCWSIDSTTEFGKYEDYAERGEWIVQYEDDWDDEYPLNRPTW